jgi:hypothetical protein
VLSQATSPRGATSSLSAATAAAVAALPNISVLNIHHLASSRSPSPSASSAAVRLGGTSVLRASHSPGHSPLSRPVSPLGLLHEERASAPAHHQRGTVATTEHVSLSHQSRSSWASGATTNSPRRSLSAGAALPTYHQLPPSLHQLSPVRLSSHTSSPSGVHSPTRLSVTDLRTSLAARSAHVTSLQPSPMHMPPRPRSPPHGSHVISPRSSVASLGAATLGAGPLFYNNSYNSGSARTPAPSLVTAPPPLGSTINGLLPSFGMLPTRTPAPSLVTGAGPATAHQRLIQPLELADLLQPFAAGSGSGRVSEVQSAGDDHDRALQVSLCCCYTSLPGTCA